ncbi:flagellar basal body L-ring protein FlgH [Ferrigenium sp. UT5]|uniref:flagellar basal body L-ring protein FlgH n=1 Tax=Ferrigenium sp. UT5 TaxID=3242105 RepID=UPI00354B8C27
MRRVIILLGVSVPLISCVPTTHIREPLTAVAPAAAPVHATNGAIFQAGVNDRPLFEDRIARRVGDLLTITIAEATSATGKSDTTHENSGSSSLVSSLTNRTLSGNSSLKSASTNDASGTNTFTGTLTATVVEVLPNGNLRVAGEKQVNIRHSNEYVRFSGVVFPQDIKGDNSVLSTRVADVHLEYKGTTSLDVADVSSMFARIFASVLPF